MKTKRAKGDFSKTNYEGRKFWFSDWINEIATLIANNGPLSNDVTHWILVDAFKKNVTAEYFYSNNR